MKKVKLSDKIFTVGSRGSRSGTDSTELMDVKTWKWTTRKPYPYMSKIYAARSLYYKGSFLVFGGTDYNTNYDSMRIAAYTPTTDSWTERGFMKSGRSYTSVINFGDEFLIIGAYYIKGDKQSEKIYYDGNMAISRYQAPSMPASSKNNLLTVSNFHIAFYNVFPVSQNYCMETRIQNATDEEP